MALTNPATTNAVSSQADGHSATIGSTSDASTATTLVGLLKKLVSLLPTALVSGRLDTQASQATAANLNATAAQGAGSGSAATFWYSRITDGTNTMPTMDAAARSGYQRVTDGTNTAAVKAASTAAVASDPSLVVTVSPNSKPAGSSFQWRGAATSELLKSGAGVLRRVICGSNVAGSITLYDNTSATGTVIASLTTTTSTPFNSVEINATFSTGLYAVSTGMSGGSYTIVWD